jgi:NAD(P)-dependent dehydrogenase (short-subunit alcohol dehydrogenase family)
VNCAGVIGPVGRINEVDLGEWRRALDVNLFGVVTSCALFAPALARAGGGSIVNLSGGGLGGPGVQSNISAYTSAKAAVAVLTETLARELEPLQIRVNAVAPGALPTELMRPVLDAGPERAGAALHETARQIYENGGGTQDGTLGDDFAELLDFLVSDDSSALSGRLLSARWESPDLLRAELDAIRAGSRFTLRRIDEELFGEK